MKWFPRICLNVGITEMNGLMEMTQSEVDSERKEVPAEEGLDVSTNVPGECGDVVVRVNEEQEFRLHMLPLMNASGYFRNLPSSSSGGDELVHQPTGCKFVTIHDLPGE